MLNKSLFLLLLLVSLSCAAAQTVLEVIPLFNRPATELQPYIAPLLTETDQVVAKDFNLIIRTTPARLAEIKALIKKLDTAPTNLSIRVIQSKDKTAEQLNAGVNVDVVVPINRPANASGQITGGIQQRQQQRSSNNEQVLRTMEGRPAYIRTGINAPIRFTTYSPGYYDQPAIATNTQYIEATTGFAVLPRLNGNDVILEISPWSDQMNNNGVINTQSEQTTIKAKLGQWVEIGTVNESSQASGTGLFSVEQSSSQNTVRILVQVEKAL
jgi:type II secretory pathway component GspD/PulD (secretin)